MHAHTHTHTPHTHTHTHTHTQQRKERKRLCVTCQRVSGNVDEIGSYGPTSTEHTRNQYNYIGEGGGTNAYNPRESSLSYRNKNLEWHLHYVLMTRSYHRRPLSQLENCSCKCLTVQGSLYICAQKHFARGKVSHKTVSINYNLWRTRRAVKPYRQAKPARTHTQAHTKKVLHVAAAKITLAVTDTIRELLLQICVAAKWTFTAANRSASCR